MDLPGKGNYNIICRWIGDRWESVKERSGKEMEGIRERVQGTLKLWDISDAM